MVRELVMPPFNVSRMCGIATLAPVPEIITPDTSTCTRMCG